MLPNLLHLEKERKEPAWLKALIVVVVGEPSKMAGIQNLFELMSERWACLVGVAAHTCISRAAMITFPLTHQSQEHNHQCF